MKPTSPPATAALSRLLALSLPEDNRAQTLRQQLQPGQTLSAKVLESPQLGMAKLELLNTQLLARTNLPLQPGQTLLLEVVKQGQLPELRLLQSPAQENPSQQVLRQALPRQIPLHESLQAFRQLARGQTAIPLPAQSRPLIETLANRSLPIRQLTAERLQQLVQGSGLFTEALLAQGKPVAASDQKLLLWKLLAALMASRGSGEGSQPTTRTSTQGQADTLRTILANTQGTDAKQASNAPQEQQRAEAQRALESGLLNRLTRLVEGSLARIHTQQAAALPQDDSGPRQAWQLELPISVKDEAETLRLQINQDAASDPEREAQHRWRVQLDFDFGNLGALQATVLLEGNKVSTTFWCEREHTEQKFDLRLPELASAFNKAGLEVGELHTRHGIPERKDPVRPPASLLDERA